jgi:hypothetical protein
MTGARADEPQALRRSQEGEGGKMGRTKIPGVLEKPESNVSTRHLFAFSPLASGF